MQKHTNMKTKRHYKLLALLIVFAVGCNKPDNPNNGGGNNNGVNGDDVIQEGALLGKYTINERGDQVFFSQGNLQYQASSNTWRFAENQWSFVGGWFMGAGKEYGNVYENEVKCDNELIAPDYSGWIDLFGWGTSGWNSGAVCYQPYSVSSNDSDYFLGGSYENDMIGAYSKADWGVYNTISNGGSRAGLWRTLSKAEWEYVLMNRRTSSGIRFAKGNVNEVNGLILLPDDWNVSMYFLNNTNQTESSFGGNVISVSDWETMESNGAVFLPLGGNRFGNYYCDAGNYWTINTNGFGELYGSYLYPVCYLRFDSHNVTVRSDGFRKYGQSVRLVCSTN